MATPLWTGSDWSFDLIYKIWNQIEIISNELSLSYHTPQIEIIGTDQMLDAYTSIGMPVYYKHWSFGKQFVQEQKNYQSGRSGLAYEIVINSDPLITYLMEDNTTTTQALVLAHSISGHGHFFKNNYLFQQWTDASSIIDYLIFARDYIDAQEVKHGRKAVEDWLDSCHALMDYGVNRYKRPSKLSMDKEKARQNERSEYLQSQVSELYRILPKEKEKDIKISKFPAQPEENLLYFFEKYSPDIENWQREILRIVRKIAQYFYPQGQCLTGNHLISTPAGLLRFDELIKNIGYNKSNNIIMLSEGNKFVNASHTYKRKAKVLKLVTGTGKTFTGTPEHPLTILRNGKEILSKIEDITTQDYIVTNLSYDIFSKTNQKLTFNIDKEKIKCNICGLTSDFIGSHISQVHKLNSVDYHKTTGLPVSNEFSRIKKSTNVIKKIPTKMDTHLASLLGYMSHVRINDYNSTIEFSHNNKQIVSKYKNLLNIIFKLDIPIKLDKFGRSSVTFNSYTFKKFINDNFADLYHKSVPLKIRLSSKEIIKEYIKSFIDINSTNRKTIGNWKLNGYQDHIQLFEQIQTILYGFGIVSKITQSQRLTYEGICVALGLPEDKSHQKIVETISLSIITDHQSLFDLNIGSNLNYKKSVNTNKDHIIPYAKSLLDVVRKQLIVDRKNHAKNYNLSNMSLSYKQKIKNKLLVKQNFISSTDLPEINVKEITHNHVLKYWTKFQNLKKCDYIPEATYLLQLIEKSYGKFYDKIDSISTELEEQFVYDVTIPSNHLFWVDGVISHNTKVMNEGFASTVHYKIMNILNERGLSTNGAHLEFLALHTNVLYQPWHNSKYFSGINPYKFGFAMLEDIERMCNNPTEEDLHWFPQLKNQNGWEIILDSVANYRDESFIRQWLSPKVIRDFRFFNVYDDRHDSEKYLVTKIHNDSGYEDVRTTLADQYLRSSYVPQIEVFNVDKKTRGLTLLYTSANNRTLGNTDKMVPHIKKLWGGYPVTIVDNTNTILCSM